VSKENVKSWKLLIAAAHPASELGVLPAGVRALIDQADEILVMVPTLPGRLAWLAGEIDKTREVADARLHAILGQLEDADEPAEGVVGSDDPLVAFGDAVADFGPDHILIALRSRDEGGWQEKGLVDQVLKRFGLPVTIFELEAAGLRE
jgi:hypothetical protein